MTKKLPGVSAVIPSFNDKEKVFRLLDSLRKSVYPKLEIIVVVNGGNETLIEGRKIYKTSLLLRNKKVKWIDAGRENIGQTGCYNLGFAYADKKNHILFVDSDVIVDRKMIMELVKTLESDSAIGIITPMILYLSDKKWVNQAGSYVNLVTGKVTVGWGPKKDFLKAHEVQNSGTAMLISRKVLDKIGGVDNWFLCYFDPDYCLRAKRAGFTTWYEPKAECFHDQSKDPGVWRPRVLSRAYLLGRNRVLFMRRHGNILTFAFFLPLLLAYYFFEALRFRRLGKFFELAWGSLVGFFYPLGTGNYIPLPTVKTKV